MNKRQHGMVTQAQVMTLGQWLGVHLWRRPERLLLLILLVLGGGVWLRHSEHPPDPGEQILEEAPVLPPVTALGPLSELVVATRRAPGSYWTEPDGRTLGIEHDLALGLGAFLGKPVHFLVLDDLEQVMRALRTGKAHFAAMPEGEKENSAQGFMFTPPYYHSRFQIVFNALRQSAPHTLSDLANDPLTLVHNPQMETQLQGLRTQVPGLRWKWAPRGVQEEDLLRQVYEGQVGYAVGASEEIALAQNDYPDLAVAFGIGQETPLAWAFPLGSSLLYEAALHFMEGFRNSGGLAQVVERYYGSVGALSHDDALEFLQKRVVRLPNLSPIFRAAERLSGLDWRLLAALSFQESRWNNQAVSPTGVRGLMMLTADTADHLGVTDRLDPNQAVPAAALYLARIRNELPLPIEEPDRTWIALAAYNVGLAHVEDARQLARQRGLNDRTWNALRQTLPLLAEPRYYEQVRHGFARGGEPVRLVENVRGYYDVLVHFESDSRIFPVESHGPIRFSPPI
ncbi:membrane-bound lytic murein transglycosylase MltF [Ferrovum sp.]|uniref:membrane-bound lytic murein transglycosylase MltF n=2 Tax=Ferrovum sp. TaxID=2609467 RepID=UPI0026196A62|nr:membrane-bound lytic murein transglycosylase MltF [Ferrovum sp.]